MNHRLAQHKSALRGGYHCNKFLQHSWKKDGESNFSFVVIKKSNEDDLIYDEQKWIDFYKAANPQFGYNLCGIAGRRVGYRASFETRQKQSESNAGRKHSEETKKKISAAHIGKTVSMDAREKISAAKKGIKANPEHVAKRAEAQKNPSAETRAKISLACTGRVFTEEAISKRVAALKATVKKRKDDGVYMPKNSGLMRGSNTSGFPCVTRNGPNWAYGFKVHGVCYQKYGFKTPKDAYDAYLLRRREIPGQPYQDSAALAAIEKEVQK